ncbi:TIM barrel protein [Roseicella aquatilis]|uniref:Sugar phosphate isomerase n=1 Tax=Roseicella aquatilis TaxID=2527868 RepID=A0A4R4DSK5_9PROT|nr:TIM barrel protein [Roseicella aquatilis]TCZ64790.1 sugar phosphate isomerase [Roseicella aquatilis]
MSASPVFITLGAFGADLVRSRGQAAFLPLIAASGAAGAEIRRELFAAEEEPPLGALRAELAARGLRCRYSAPFELWAADGTPSLDGLSELIAEAEALGAEALKIALGHYAGSPCLLSLREVVERSPVRILVENDQTAHGGSLAPMAAFARACTAEGIGLGVTCDIGNWSWTGTDPEAAVRALAPHTVYVHTKAVQRRDGKLAAVPLDPAADAPWRALVAAFPRDLPRAIEFPLAGPDIEIVTRFYVDMLAAA